jgi:hypothetical protein
MFPTESAKVSTEIATGNWKMETGKWKEGATRFPFPISRFHFLVSSSQPRYFFFPAGAGYVNFNGYVGAST